MKRKRFTEEQIIGVLREHEVGAKTGDLARKHGISEATLYNWKAKYGGMDVSDAKKQRALEDENDVGPGHPHYGLLVQVKMLAGNTSYHYAFCNFMLMVDV